MKLSNGLKASLFAFVFLFLGLSSINASVVYSLVSPLPQTGDEITLSGTITTNGNVNPIFDASTDIESFNINVSINGSPTDTLTDADDVFKKLGIDAIGSNLVVTLFDNGIIIGPIGSGPATNPRLKYVQSGANTAIEYFPGSALSGTILNSHVIATSAVPEPSAFLLFGFIGLGYAGRKWFIRRRSK